MRPGSLVPGPPLKDTLIPPAPVAAGFTDAASKLGTLSFLRRRDCNPKEAVESHLQKCSHAHPSWPRLGPDHRTLSRLHSADFIGSQRQDRNRAGIICPSGLSQRVR